MYGYPLNYELPLLVIMNNNVQQFLSSYASKALAFQQMSIEIIKGKHACHSHIHAKSIPFMRYQFHN